MSLLLATPGIVHKAPSGSSFDPAVDLFGSSEVGFWLEANTSDLFTDDGVTNVTTAGDSVAQWNDRSPNGLVFRDFPTAPTYQTTGAAHVDFAENGAFDLQSAIDPFNTGVTVIAGIRPDSNGANRQIINFDQLLVGASGARLFQFRQDFLTLEFIGFDGSGGTVTARGGTMSIGSSHVAMATFSASEAATYLDSSTASATATNTAGSLQSGTLAGAIGAATDASPNNYFDGEVFAVGLVDRVLSTAEMDDVITYVQGIMP